MPYIQVEQDVKLYVKDWGSGKPIVFLHGWPFSYECFEYQSIELPKHAFRFLGIDLRGYGRSDKPWTKYNYDIYADDILTVLRALDVKDAMLVGHSMGGSIAMRYLARHKSERVSKVAFLAAAAPCFTQREGFPHGLTKEVCNQFIDLCKSDRAQLLVNFGKNFFHTEDSVSPAFAEWMRALGMGACPHATRMCLEALRDTDLRPDMAKIEIPAYILHGTDDKICPYGLAEAMHKGIKNSTLMRYEKAGHGFFYDERERVNLDLMKIAQQPV